MAKPVCTYCDTYEGILLVTNLDDGETQVVCPNDLIMWTLSMTGQLTQGMTPEQAGQYGQLLDQISANDARPPKPRPRGRAAKAAPPADPPPAPDVAVAPALARVELPDACPACGNDTALGDADKLVCEQCGEVLATSDDAA